MYLDKMKSREGANLNMKDKKQEKKCRKTMCELEMGKFF